MNLEFEWDKEKNDANLKKHGISFESAKNVFSDRNRVKAQDNRKNYGESRWNTIGNVNDIIIHVSYTVRADLFRLISARKASKKERECYYACQNNS
jgi:uncharacterized DUF497 family protein